MSRQVFCATEFLMEVTLNSTLLLCHPQPYPTESYLGYILRLSDNNGYSSPSSLYRLAGVTRLKRKTGLDSAILATMTHGSIPDLQAISYQTAGRYSSRVRLLGQEVNPKHLLFTTAKLCPECVAEKGFVEAHWDLKLMVGCPVHRRLAARVCPNCNKLLRHLRPGLLECRCGGDLLKSDLAPISSDDVSLLALIRSKILGTSLPDGEFLTLPHQELLAMNLRSMLIVIEVVGKHRLLADNRADVKDEYQIIQAAAQVLKEWPANFYTLLGDIGSLLPNGSSGGVGRQFKSICNALFRNPLCSPPEHADFLRSAFVEFTTKHWDKGFATGALMKPLRKPDSDRFITMGEWAARAGVNVKTAANYLKKNGRQASLRRFHNGFVRVVVDKDNPIPSVILGKVFRLTEAAELLGIPKWLLSTLRSSEFYESHHRGPWGRGFHECDLNAFQQKLIGEALSQRQLRVPRNQCMSLRTILSNTGNETSRKDKEKFVRLLISKELIAVGNEDGTVGGLLVRRVDYDKFRETQIERCHRNYFVKMEVAKLLDCDESLIDYLVDSGLLRGSKMRRWTAVDKDSVRGFASKYISLNSLAKRAKVSVKTILRFCEEKQLTLVFPGEDQPRTRSFISVADGTILTANNPLGIVDEVVQTAPSSVPSS
jgi:hypothetical protein